MKITAASSTLPWCIDTLKRYAFRLQVPYNTRPADCNHNNDQSREVT